MSRFKLDYLLLRLRMGRGNTRVLVAEIVKTHNAIAAERCRRSTDMPQVIGWLIAEPST